MDNVRVSEVTMINTRDNRQLTIFGVYQVLIKPGKNGYALYQLDYMYKGKLLHKTFSTFTWDRVIIQHF